MVEFPDKVGYHVIENIVKSQEHTPSPGYFVVSQRPTEI